MLKAGDKVIFKRNPGLAGTVTGKTVVAFTECDPWRQVIWSDGREEVFPEAFLVKITEEEYTARALMGESEEGEFSGIEELVEMLEGLGKNVVLHRGDE